ncbi:hypothetical protein VCRA2126O85_60199 [Vibrio crassostreae]|nr:hypothetical protein VCRA2125O83_60031 [Vibrio crassostreae]CAK3059049.1 hypothetical protein VCRA2126O84_60031 [Vibrio crassostreae]CAK3072159.1 hypothetical protein VCRA2126O86_60199 [Vibrio crassostreae]CAK3074266.1 hypothetical protein VCRA2126O85_60199 [Vibrio crassostreae]CAK3074628.1 hypothetical protein VCRA2128O106_60200 [Vibrio crassostreae]
MALTLSHTNKKGCLMAAFFFGSVLLVVQPLSGPETFLDKTVLDLMLQLKRCRLGKVSQGVQT